MGLSWLTSVPASLDTPHSFQDMHVYDVQTEVHKHAA